MILRRSKEPAEPSPPVPAWRARVDEARALIRSQGTPPWVDDRLDEVERSLAEAEEDRQRLAAAIERLEPERATSELKEALRSGRIEESRVAALRRRHDTVHELLNRRDALESRIDAAVVDLELLAARVLTMSTGDAEDEVGTHLERLRDDIRALEQAHDELGSL